jgi:hypothetical protein
MSVAGIADRAYAKMLHADSPSGRVASFPTLETVMALLYPDGYDVEVRARTGPRLDAQALRHKIKRARWATLSAPARRDMMAELSKRATSAARSAGRMKLTKKRRREIGRMAIAARWKRSKTDHSSTR